MAEKVVEPTSCPEHGDLCGRPNWTGYCHWRVERASDQSPDYYDALSAAESRIGELEKERDQARQEVLEELRSKEAEDALARMLVENKRQWREHGGKAREDAREILAGLKGFLALATLDPSGEWGGGEQARAGRDAEEKLRRVSRIIKNGQSGGRSDAEILETIRDALESATAPWPPTVCAEEPHTDE